GVAALERALPEGADLLIEGRAHPRDLGLAHAGDPELLDHPLDLARRDAVDEGLHDHRHQGLFAARPRLEKAREVTPGAQLGDEQLEAARAGIPAALAVAVSVGGALGRRPLGQARAD